MMMIADIVQLEDDEPLAEQVELLVAVEQVVVLAAPVVGLQHVQETVDVEVFLPYVLLAQQAAVVAAHELVEGVERGRQRRVLLQLRKVEVHGVREGHLLGARGSLVVPLPQGEDQCLDRLALLDVEHPVGGIEGVETDRLLLRIGQVDAVPAPAFLMDQVAKALVRVPRIDQDDMRSLFIILADHVVREEALAAPAGSQDELVPVGDHAPLHRFVRDVQMHRHPRQAVHHLDAEG